MTSQPCQRPASATNRLQHLHRLQHHVAVVRTAAAVVAVVVVSATAAVTTGREIEPMKCQPR